MGMACTMPCIPSSSQPYLDFAWIRNTKLGIFPPTLFGRICPFIAQVPCKRESSPHLKVWVFLLDLLTHCHPSWLFNLPTFHFIFYLFFSIPGTWGYQGQSAWNGGRSREAEGDAEWSGETDEPQLLQSRLSLSYPHHESSHSKSYLHLLNFFPLWTPGFKHIWLYFVLNATCKSSCLSLNR